LIKILLNILNNTISTATWNALRIYCAGTATTFLNLFGRYTVTSAKALQEKICIFPV
jgi:hypothetical protein